LTDDGDIPNFRKIAALAAIVQDDETRSATFARISSRIPARVPREAARNLASCASV
jgi:hypothetical protein